MSRLEVRPQPGYTYRLDLAGRRIVGMVDGLDAVTQMVYKTLYTERYAYLIYDWDYGMELEQYLGKDMGLVMAELAAAITEAIEGDDRVLAVRDFKMEKTRIDTLYVEFTVDSTEGETRTGLEVPVG
jgi:hypothetical protein